jgi:hypothetical protein
MINRQNRGRAFRSVVTGFSNGTTYYNIHTGAHMPVSLVYNLYKEGWGLKTSRDSSIEDFYPYEEQFFVPRGFRHVELDRVHAAAVRKLPEPEKNSWDIPILRPRGNSRR